MSNRNTPTSFLNGPNYQKVVVFLRQHYSTKLGQAIPQRMDERLQKTVQHYMTEVARIQGNKPVASLNQEVVRETIGSMDVWLKKQESAQPPTTTTIGTLPRGTSAAVSNEEYNRLFSDTSSRYEAVLAERQPPAITMPVIPDFSLGNLSIENEEDPVVLMERMAKAREEQARLLGINPPTLEVKEKEKLVIKEEAPPSSIAPVPPQAEAPPPLLAPRPQEYIIPQEDIQKYREIEYNVFLTSSDRDWLRNTTENRYNFSVNFNARAQKNGSFNFNASLINRFRNIQRIEFVKAILPLESLTTLVRVTNIVGSTATYDINRVINVFSLPFVGVRIQELENNGFSTKVDEDSTFAMIQYDTTWSSDLLAPNSASSPLQPLTKSGFTGWIPKFLKNQKIYAPTPLATLQRLSIRLERHSGDLLSADSDVQFINQIFLSSSLTVLGAGTSLYSSTVVTTPQNAYIFIRTTKWFPFSAVAEGDNILIQGYVTGYTTPAARDFEMFINRAQGHNVVAVGNSNSGVYSDGRNAVGYCNVIIIRSRFDDPTNGSIGRTSSSYFGSTQALETALTTTLDNASNAVQTASALLNLSRQVHVVLRIITRDYDNTANIRPDNV
jgi:hypothetical protein